ncbi:MAG: DNA polymerase III subunit delta [Alistipes sp.]|nr:DNA polymerase III subunit delta [Alistipes sp.]
MRFCDITGQEELKRKLAEAIDAGRISHAQLFTGMAGAGTLPLAIAYVQYLNCRNRRGGDACGECPDCRQIENLAHPDLHFVFPVNKQGKKSGEVVLSDDFLPLWRSAVAETGGYFTLQEWFERLDLGKTLKGIISAKEADEIIRKLSFKSFEAEYKSVIVWMPETMNEEAANKILKILEEPWEKTLFLLVSERGDLLLQTIRSRTQEVAVPRLSPATLEAAAAAAGVSDPHKARTFARLAEGDLTALRHLSEGTADERRSDNFALFRELMRYSYNDRHLELLNWAEEAAALTRERQLSLFDDSARLLRDSFILHAGAADAVYLYGEEEEFCRKFAPFIGARNIEPIIAETETAKMQIARNGNPKIVFTHFALAVSKMIKRLQ